MKTRGREGEEFKAEKSKEGAIAAAVAGPIQASSS